MDKSYYERRNKLVSKRAKLKKEKDWALAGMRRYPARIQRAAIAGLRRAIAEIERELDELAIAESNMAATRARNIEEALNRSLPLGTRTAIDPDMIPEEFGFWRADKSSLIMAFGALRADMSAYIDDIPMPDLFIGPFRIPESGLECMLLLDEAAAYDAGWEYIRIIPEVYVDKRRLAALPDTDPDTSPLQDAFKLKRNGIALECGRRIRADLELQGTFSDPIARYHAYRSKHAAYTAARHGEGLSEKEKKLARRLKRRFGLIKYERDR